MMFQKLMHSVCLIGFVLLGICQAADECDTKTTLCPTCKDVEIKVYTDASCSPEHEVADQSKFMADLINNEALWKAQQGCYSEGNKSKVADFNRNNSTRFACTKSGLQFVAWPSPNCFGWSFNATQVKWETCTAISTDVQGSALKALI